jgi:hypothetical protein
MLDSFLEVACEHEKKASAYQSLVSDFRRLPKAELQALAAGRSKLASLCGDDESWLDKFEGTPLHEQALVLEQESLENDIAKEQRRLARTEEEDAERLEHDAEYRADDAIRLKKRILDLELNKLRLVASTGEPEVEEEEPVVEDEEVEEEPASEEEEPGEPEEVEQVEEEEPPAATRKEPEKSDEEVKKAAARMRQRLQKVAAQYAAPVQTVTTLGLQKHAIGAFGMLRGLGRAAVTGLRQDGAGRALSNVGRGLVGYTRKNPKAALGAAGLGAAGLVGAGALGGGALGFGMGRGTAR